MVAARVCADQTSALHFWITIRAALCRCARCTAQSHGSVDGNDDCASIQTITNRITSKRAGKQWSRTKLVSSRTSLPTLGFLQFSWAVPRTRGLPLTCPMPAARSNFCMCCPAYPQAAPAATPPDGIGSASAPYLAIVIGGLSQCCHSGSDSRSRCRSDSTPTDYVPRVVRPAERTSHQRWAVADADVGDATFAQCSVQRRLVARVQGGCGLVHEQQARLRQQHPAHGCHLLPISVSLTRDRACHELTVPHALPASGLHAH